CQFQCPQPLHSPLLLSMTFSSEFGQCFPKNLGFFGAAIVRSSNGCALSGALDLTEVLTFSWTYFALETIQIFTF
ncbi:MAG: hypothetical protein MJE77_25220, partial [Proteobacteria bacterium]|nr:hypothetical protein [Pseudomonadota bacterium]